MGPDCRTTVAYLERGCPVPASCSDVLSDVVDLFGVRVALTKEVVLEPAAKGALNEVSHNGKSTAVACS